MEFENYFLQTIDFLIKFWHFLQKPASAAFGTGLGIILGNTIINLSKHTNYIKDISKLFDLIINNQLDDLYNIRIACSNINNRITTHYINFLICRINIVTCLGLIAKKSVKQFDDKAKKDLLKTFQETCIVTDAVENSNSLYVLLKEDYEIISNFIQKTN